MFGERATKKFERQRLLDVRSRSLPVKALRLRWAAGALAISIGVVGALFAFWRGGELLVDRWFMNHPRFAIERIEIVSDGIIPLEQIRAWAGVAQGQNLLALDLRRVKRDLELVPLIEAAAVERILPRGLVIRVREREPIARVVLFAARPVDGLLEPVALYLDEHGMVIPPVLRTLNRAAFDAATVHLPTLTGVGTAAFRPGHIVSSGQILKSLQWVRAFQASEMARFARVRAIDLSSENTLLVTTEQGGEITFGLDHFESQLARWQSVRQASVVRGRHLAALDLAVTNYVPAIWHAWQGLTNAPPAVFQPEIPSPYRRKHV